MPVFSATTKVELTKANVDTLKDVAVFLDLMANGAALVPDVQVQAACKAMALTSGLLKAISHFVSLYLCYLILSFFHFISLH
jgi:hypothetical protein